MLLGHNSSLISLVSFCEIITFGSFIEYGGSYTRFKDLQAEVRVALEAMAQRDVMLILTLALIRWRQLPLLIDKNKNDT